MTTSFFIYTKAQISNTFQKLSDNHPNPNSNISIISLRQSGCSAEENKDFVCIASLIEYALKVITPQGCSMQITMSSEACIGMTPNGITVQAIFELDEAELLSPVSPACLDFIINHPEGVLAALDEIEIAGVEQYELDIMSIVGGDLGIDDCSQPTLTTVAEYLSVSCSRRCLAGFDLQTGGIWQNRPCSNAGCCIKGTYYCFRPNGIEVIGEYSEVVGSLSDCKENFSMPCFEGKDAECRVRGCQ